MASSSCARTEAGVRGRNEGAPRRQAAGRASSCHRGSGRGARGSWRAVPTARGRLGRGKRCRGAHSRAGWPTSSGVTGVAGEAGVTGVTGVTGVAAGWLTSSGRLVQPSPTPSIRGASRTATGSRWPSPCFPSPAPTCHPIRCRIAKPLLLPSSATVPRRQRQRTVVGAESRAGAATELQPTRSLLLL